MVSGPIVVDANIVIAALIADGGTRELILDTDLDLRSPPWLWEELAVRYHWLLERTKLSPPALDAILRRIRERIVDVPTDAIQSKRADALARVTPAQRDDAPYVAATLAVGGTLWTHDHRLARGAGVPVITTAELAKREERP